MIRLLGKRPWPDPEDWRAYLPDAQATNASAAAPASPAQSSGAQPATPPPAPSST